MRQTLQHLKREKVREVFNKVLHDDILTLAPLSIKVSEAFNEDFTNADFSFEERSREVKKVEIKDSKGKGFIDCLFTGLHNTYVSEYQSLKKVKLTDLTIRPIRTVGERSLGTDAYARVIFGVEISKFGTAEFHYESRSVIYSGFFAALEAFQFYINCEKTFNRLQLTLEDARQRNRGDIIQRCLYDLSKITEVNTYDKRKEV